MSVRLVFGVLLAMVGPSVLASEAFRAPIEADWQRHDASRVAQLTQPNALRLPGKLIEWPGLPGSIDQVVPRTAAPQIDGDPGEPHWDSALQLAPAGR
ncbi:MAG: hypothetical protein FJX74_22775, partial [Armatimonadetes bacterium]|nr:hypothetical protein [Armatimonadota bacterium]